MKEEIVMLGTSRNIVDDWIKMGKTELIMYKIKEIVKNDPLLYVTPDTYAFFVKTREMDEHQNLKKETDFINQTEIDIKNS